MRSRASTLLLEFPSVFSENRIVRWATRKRLSLIRQWRRRFGTAKIANSKVHPKRDSEWPKCISQELQLAQQEETPRTQRHIQPYVPLPGFGCLGGVFAVGGCCNLWHFVHKLLHS